MRPRPERGPAGRWIELNLRHFQALQAVAEEASFNRAARRLGYTQSAVSQQIAALERIVGERLIDRRKSRPVTLTDAGKLLLDHLQAISARLDAAQADLEALRNGAGGRLRVGSPQSVGSRVLAGLLQRFSSTYAGVELEFYAAATDVELIELVNNIHDANNNNLAYFSNGTINKKLDAANKLTGDARYKAYGNLDVEISAKHAPWASYDNRNSREFVSKRTGGYLFQPANASADLNTFFLK